MQELLVSREEVLEYAACHRKALAGDTHSMSPENRQAAGSFREWLSACGRGEGVPFLKNLDLRGVDVSHGDFSGIRVQGSSFEGADISHAEFRHAHMPKLCFNYVMAQDTGFSGARMQGCHFTGARLLGSGPPAMNEGRREVDFTGAQLAGAVFDRSLCRNILFTSAQMEGSRFRGSELQNVRFKHANLVGADFTGCKPHFRHAVGTRSHPFGIETVDAMMIGAQGLKAFAGHLEHAITEPAALTGGVRRMAIMSRGSATEPPLAGFLQLQAESRRGAARAVLQRDCDGTQEERRGLADALELLNRHNPAPDGFAARERQRENGKTITR